MPPSSVPEGGLVPGLQTSTGAMTPPDYYRDVWRMPVRHFCESEHAPAGQPEYLSAFSSLAITIVSLAVLFSGRHHCTVSKLCAAVLAWCGVGSFGFHWTLSQAWSFLDTFPMTLSSALGLYLGWLVAIGEAAHPHHPHQSPPTTERLGRRRSLLLGGTARGSRAMSGVALSVAALVLTCLALNAVYGNVTYDNIFTLVGAAILLTVLIVRALINRRRRRLSLKREGRGQEEEETADGSSSSTSSSSSSDDEEEEEEEEEDTEAPVEAAEGGEQAEEGGRSTSMSQASLAARQEHYAAVWGDDQALSVMVVGVLCAVVAGGLWETSERLCPLHQWAWLRYLRLHSLWHLSIGYGTCLILQAFTYLSAPCLYGCTPHFANRLPYKWLNTALPEVVYVVEEEEARRRRRRRRRPPSSNSVVVVMTEEQRRRRDREEATPLVGRGGEEGGEVVVDV